MERREPKDSAQADTSPKSKQTKKSLCRMLMNKKTKVGCLEVPFREGDLDKDLKLENSQHASNSSIKLSLCCAMTERSRTPPQGLIEDRSSCSVPIANTERLENNLNNGNCLHEVAVEKSQDTSPPMRRTFCSDCCEKKNCGVGEQSRSAVCTEVPERETNLECNDRSRTAVKINTLHQVLDKVADMKNLEYVGCQAHNEELTKRVIYYYLVMRGHFLARSVNENNHARKIKTKDNRKKIKTVRSIYR